MIVARIVTINRMTAIAETTTAEEATTVVAIGIVEAGAIAGMTAGTIATRTKRAYALTVVGQGIPLRNAEPINVLSAGSLRI